MKILYLYAGIGGSRFLWDNSHEVTAIENNKSIADIYKYFFPFDNLIITDAHKFLLDNYKSFDFIFSSPPCPSHSRLNKISYNKKNNLLDENNIQPKYPDLKLYEEIIFLQNFSKSFFCVENVISYYQPLIQPKLINKHYLWANFFIPDIDLPITNVEYGNYHYWEKLLGFKLPRIKTDIRKDKLLRNTMNPKLGLHILNSMLYSSGIKNSYFQTPLF